MELYAAFRYNDEEIRYQHCVVEKVLELTESEYGCFSESPLVDYDFIADHRDLMCQAADGIRHCCLVLEKKLEDGILIEAEGYVPFDSKIQLGDGRYGGAVYSESHCGPAERNVPDSDRCVGTG